jgi:hypothetical protein
MNFQIKLISKYKPIVCALKNYNLNPKKKNSNLNRDFNLERIFLLHLK